MNDDEKAVRIAVPFFVRVKSYGYRGPTETTTHYTYDVVDVDGRHVPGVRSCSQGGYDTAAKARRAGLAALRDWGRRVRSRADRQVPVV